MSRQVEQLPSTIPASVRSRPERFEQLIAGLVVVALGTRIYVGFELSFAVVIGLALLPVWWRRVRDFVGARELITGVVIACVLGVWLSVYSASDDEVIGRQRVLNLVLVLSLLVGIGLVLWARTVLPDLTVALLFGVGMLGDIRVNAGFLESPWKFGLDKPVSLVVLALACSSRRRFLPPIVLTLLALVGGLSGARSRSAILLVALVLVLWQALPTPKSIKAATARALGAVALWGLRSISSDRRCCLRVRWAKKPKPEPRSRLPSPDPSSSVAGQRWLRPGHSCATVSWASASVSKSISTTSTRPRPA